MADKAVISLTTGMADAEKVTVALLVAVGAAELGRPTLMFLTKEAVRLALDGVACDGCPALPDLFDRYHKAGGRLLVCPICFNARKLNDSHLRADAEIGGTVPMWEWSAMTRRSPSATEDAGADWAAGQDSERQFLTREVADMLHAPIGTVLARLHRARKHFEKFLWDYARDNDLLRNARNNSRRDAVFKLHRANTRRSHDRDRGDPQRDRC